jgi:adenine-specific DNA-methyltransferase
MSRPKTKKSKNNNSSRARNTTAAAAATESYRHPTAESPLRPEVGTQAQFRKKKPPVTYRYDSSLSPALDWDGQNGARELGEWLLACIEEASRIPTPHQFETPREFKNAGGKVIATVRGLADAVEQLKRLSKPFLNWAGKAERLSFDVPTLPLFIHERLSTKAIIETLTGHKKDKQLEFDLFGDPQHPITDQVLKAYEYKDKWVNRMILGDSLVVMNSLLHYEGLGGQVQMIYMDPPYGVKFGSNFQPFVRKRDVTHNDDVDMTREPEMVKAYRDTWELNEHSYLTYLRDRILLARDLLTPSGSIFIQISDENLHHVRELMDEIFGVENFVSIIHYTTSGGFTSKTLSRAGDFLIWYAKNIDLIKYNRLFETKSSPLEDSESKYDQIELSDGTRRALTQEEKNGDVPLPSSSRVFRYDTIVSSGYREKTTVDFEFEGKKYHPGPTNNWKASVPDGMNRLVSHKRIAATSRGKLVYVRYFDDFPVVGITSMWPDVGGAVQSRSDPKIYAVQTGVAVIQRCMHMTTSPGDLVLDPTCGSGTTAYVAEQWGRRWITIDTSRVPLALARQRLLTATFPYYELTDAERGPAAGFVYSRKQNKKGEEVGGIVPHVTLKSIANNEPPDEEVLVDRPETVNSIIRVTGPFVVEATIPTPVDWEGDGVEDSGVGDISSFIDRMLEVLRRSPVLHLGGGKSVTFKNIRPPAKTLSLSAEAIVANGTEKQAAIIFGPENGAVSEKLVYEAAREAHAKSYAHLYVIGFAIQPNARKLVDDCEAAIGIAATYVQATPDLLMGDLLKNMRSSQIFSVCGLPEIRLTKSKTKGDEPKYQVELVGLDVFDPVTMELDHRSGDDVPAWFLDTDYNGLCFHVCQAFFPRTGAWDNLKRALKATHDESVWDHLAGTVSAPFEAGEHGQVAVKVIDDRGNELLVVKSLKEAKG